jgi:putative phosphoribosyl transferase
MLFEDRLDAGRRLAQRLQEFANRDDILVLALPRGGVPVGFEVSRALHAPLDIFVVRKLGVPGYEEFAMGAVASGGFHILNPDAVNGLNVLPEQIDSILVRESRELERREQLYRGNRPPLDVCGKAIIVVDDGLATGSTMRAAVLALRQRNPSRIVVAVPVSALSTCRDLEKEAEDVVCLYTPFNFHAVGQWYRKFAQTTDAEVHDFLNRSSMPAA